MSMKSIPLPLDPIFIKKNWGLQGYTYFFLFLLRNLCIEQKYEKYEKFSAYDMFHDIST